jgi:hypothetical protein
MTSQLNVDTIVDKAGSGGSNVKMANTSTYVSDGGSATQNTVQGLAKAWAHVASAFGSLPDSFNISSIDDDGTGEFGLNFTNAMGSTNYSAHMTVTFNHSSTNNTRTGVIEEKKASSVEVDSAYTAGSTAYFTPYDFESNGSVTVFGDLA